MALSNPIARASRGWAGLASTGIVAAAIWLLLLPWVAARPRMQAHLKWLENRGIDPSAMYYTELEVMDPILKRLERPR